MNHNDDGYVAMLLTMALSPDREEYARPYGVQEFHRLEGIVRETGIKRLGGLLNQDISGLMIHLNMSEEEALRAFTLIHRTVPLTYALESFERQGIDAVTCYDPDYPTRLTRKLRDAAPPFFYRCGSAALMEKPAIAISGISGVRTDAQVRAFVEVLVKSAIDQSYAILTGGEPGVSRIASHIAMEHGGTLIQMLGGGMLEHIHEDDIAGMIAEGRAAIVSLEHPEAVFTVSHAVSRNRMLFSMADAAFVFNTDGKRGELEAIQKRFCDWVYAWEGDSGNKSLIARGAIPISDAEVLDFDALSRRWTTSSSEQLSIFDMI